MGSNGNPVSGLVQATWTPPLNTVSQEEGTNGGGEATFKIFDGAGTYELCVTGVVPDDPAAGELVPGDNDCASVTVP